MASLICKNDIIYVCRRFTVAQSYSICILSIYCSDTCQWKCQWRRKIHISPAFVHLEISPSCASFLRSLEFCFFNELSIQICIRHWNQQRCLASNFFTNSSRYLMGKLSDVLQNICEEHPCSLTLASHLLQLQLVNIRHLCPTSVTIFEVFNRECNPGKNW